MDQQPQPIIIRQAPVQQQSQPQVSMSDIFYICLGNWKWFVLSVILCLGIGVFYLLRTAPVYTRTASVLIKEDTKGKSMANIAGDLSNLGLVGTVSNVNNELITFKSPALTLQLVQRMALDINYSKPGTFRSTTLYGTTLPVKVELFDMDDAANASFRLTLDSEGKCSISKMTLKGDKVDFEKPVAFGDTIESPLGRILVSQSPFFAVPENTLKIDVTRRNIYASISATSARLTAALSNKQASVIDLTYKDVNIQRAEDVLNALISLYNQNWVQDKNQISIATSQFVKERLEMIEQELGDVDSDISSYKSQNLIPDVAAASQLYMNKASQAESQVMELNNQLYMCRYVRSYVTNEANRNQLLPANSGINASNIESMINAYNNKLLERNTLAANSSTKNPLVVDLDAELVEQRRTIVLSLDNQITALQTQIQSQERQQIQSTSHLSANPTRQKYLLSVERQQKVKESLYLFLLQKREENELSQAFTAYNTRIISPAMGSLTPTSPKRMQVLAIAFLLGLLIPAAFFYMRETLYTKVRGSKDLEKLTVPRVGELPMVIPAKKLTKLQQKAERYKIVVRPEGKDIVNEAFRIVRSNLAFMVGPSSPNKSKVIMMTSANVGSGKTFVSTNLASSFAIQGSKVILVDLDIRKRTTSRFVGKPAQGVIDYLNAYTNDWKSLVLPMAEIKNLDVLPVGHVVPNPTELLQSPRLTELIEQLKANYDYVLLDCPPADVVADVNIIKSHAEMTLFIVRVGVMERDYLKTLEEFYKNGRFNNMAILLNGAELQTTRYGSRRYGSTYGYGYGAGYGYGYGDK